LAPGIGAQWSGDKDGHRSVFSPLAVRFSFSRCGCSLGDSLGNFDRLQFESFVFFAGPAQQK
jgi:hypothetical protein